VWYRGRENKEVDKVGLIDKYSIAEVGLIDKYTYTGVYTSKHIYIYIYTYHLDCLLEKDMPL
jgi:hypothetical protein